MTNTSTTSSIREYLFSRVERPGYRGAHITQHNRLQFSRAFPVLSAIHAAAGESAFSIPPGDISNDVQTMPGFEVYFEIVGKARSTPNTIKKVFFPDFGRMGLLDRMNKGGRVVPLHGRPQVFSARLTETAVRLVMAEKSEAQRMYQKAAENLVKGVSGGEEIMNVMRFALGEFCELSALEYMLILSDLRLTKEQAVNLVKEYRALDGGKRQSLLRAVERECERISAKARDKDEQRDFGNWLNEANSAFVVLDGTGHFVVRGSGRNATLKLRSE